MFFPNDFKEGQKYPLFFHLHGAGGRGNDFKEFEGSTIIDLLNRGDSPLSKAISVIPQCSGDSWFDNFNELLEFAETIVNLYCVDKSKVTASGISMGGYGIYQVMMCKPELFTKAFLTLLIIIIPKVINTPNIKL